MKTNKGFVVFLITFLAASCQQFETNEIRSEEEHIFIVSETGDNQTKTSLQSDGSIYWCPKDSIVVFYGDCCLGKFTSLKDKSASSTVFASEKTFVAGSLGGEDFSYWGVYPYNDETESDGSNITLTVPLAQIASADTFDPRAFPSIGCSPNQRIAFYNICGGVCFTVSHNDIKSVVFSGNNGELLSGRVQVAMDMNDKPMVKSVESGSKSVTITMPNGSCFIPGIKYYISLLPNLLSQGFTIKYITDTSYYEYTTTNPVEIMRSSFGVLTEKDIEEHTMEAADLCNNGTANCYIVSEDGDYKFKVVKGNSSESVGNVAIAEVLWESFGTSVAPAVGDLVSGAFYANDYIMFRASKQKGNAVIAAKDADGNILWSWHIWMTDRPEDQVYNNNAGTMMDRNLGATSATPGDVGAIGLFYQWGRKDPFLVSSSISEYVRPLSTGTWPEVVNSDASKGNITYAIENPMTFIYRNSNNRDWLYSSTTSTDDSRWLVDKTIYDPCPMGYRIPEGGSNGIWETAGFSKTEFDKMNYGISFDINNGTKTWYPASGSLIDHYYGTGEFGFYWSLTPNEYFAITLCFNRGSGVYTNTHKHNRYMGCNVRCIKE